MAVRKSTSGAHKPAPKRRPAELSVRQANKLFRALETSPCLINESDVEEIERKFEGLQDRRARRALLYSGTRTGQFLIDAITKDRESGETFAGALLCGDDYVDRLRLLADLLERCGNRLRVALAYRPDAMDVFAAADKKTRMVEGAQA